MQNNASNTLNKRLFDRSILLAYNIHSFLELTALHVICNQFLNNLRVGQGARITQILRKRELSKTKQGEGL